MPRPVSDLLARLALGSPEDPSLFQQALTHRSAQGLPHYERLEFLGDAVLKLVVSEWLYGLEPEKNEGEMTRVRARAVSDEALARAAEALDLGAYMVLGPAEKGHRGKARVGILASALEALLGAIYQVWGYQAADGFLGAWLRPEFEAALALGGQDNYKAVLQEYTQGRFKALPEYRLKAETGPEHDREYAMEVYIEGAAYGAGRGASKKSAEQAAAREALQRLRPATP